MTNTQVTHAEQKSNGKWSVHFDIMRVTSTETYRSASCESAAVFTTEVDALEGGLRAVVVLNETGAFPNMCEVW